jgi:hypothetical protein
MKTNHVASIPSGPINKFAGGIPTILLGGHAIRTALCTAPDAGSLGKNFFQSCIYIDSDISAIDSTADGRRFIEGGGVVLSLSSANLGNYAFRALDGENTDEFAATVKGIWTAPKELLHEALEGVHEANGGSVVRTVTAIAIYAQASQILSKVAGKVAEAKQGNKNPAARVPLLIVGSLTGSVGSGGSTAVASMVLKKLHRVDVHISVAAHDIEGLLAYQDAGRSALMRANYAAALTELQRLALEESPTECKLRVDLLDGVRDGLNRDQLEAAHARNIQGRFGLGVAGAAKKYQINELVNGVSGPITVSATGAHFGVPLTLETFGAAKIEDQLVSAVLEGEGTISLDAVLAAPSPCQGLPGDRSRDVLAAKSLPDAIAVTAKVVDELQQAGAEIRATLPQASDAERRRVAEAVGGTIGGCLANGVLAAQAAVAAARRRTQAIATELTHAEGLASTLSAKSIEGVEGERPPLLHRIRKLEMRLQVGLAAALATGVGLCFAGDLLALAGVAVLLGTIACIYLLIGAGKPSDQEAIQALQSKARAVRESLVLCHSLAVLAGRLKALADTDAKLKALAVELGLRRGALRLRMKEIAECEAPAPAGFIPAIDGSQFAKLVAAWIAPFPNLGSVASDAVLPALANAASLVARAKFAETRLVDAMGATLSSEAAHELAARVNSYCTPSIPFRADPSRLPQIDFYAVTDAGVVTKDLSQLAGVLREGSNRQVMVIVAQRGLYVEQLAIWDELKDAGRGLVFPTKTLVPAKVPAAKAHGIRGTSDGMGSPHEPELTVNGYASRVT